jgi:hypothetical protein
MLRRKFCTVSSTGPVTLSNARHHAHLSAFLRPSRHRFLRCGAPGRRRARAGPAKHSGAERHGHHTPHQAGANAGVHDRRGHLDFAGCVPGRAAYCVRSARGSLHDSDGGWHGPPPDEWHVVGCDAEMVSRWTHDCVHLRP